jgi:hypothetical protein
MIRGRCEVIGVQKPSTEKLELPILRVEDPPPLTPCICGIALATPAKRY